MFGCDTQVALACLRDFTQSLVRRSRPLIWPLKLTLFGCRRIGSEESGGPPPFEPSLKVERNTAHKENSGFIAPGVIALTREDLQRVLILEPVVCHFNAPTQTALNSSGFGGCSFWRVAQRYQRCREVHDRIHLRA